MQRDEHWFESGSLVKLETSEAHLMDACIKQAACCRPYSETAQNCPRGATCDVCGSVYDSVHSFVTSISILNSVHC